MLLSPWIFPINGILRHITFYIWLLLFSTFLTFIHVVTLLCCIPSLQGFWTYCFLCLRCSGSSHNFLNTLFSWTLPWPLLLDRFPSTIPSPWFITQHPVCFFQKHFVIRFMFGYWLSVLLTTVYIHNVLHTMDSLKIHGMSESAFIPPDNVGSKSGFLNFRTG